MPTTRPAPPDALDPFYYLNNFQMVLDWLAARYPDLLDPVEQRFIADFSSMARPARALLVRMVMRRGEMFRASKLNYPEIGPSSSACSTLIEAGWVQAQPLLSLEQIFALFTKPEIATLFALPPALVKAHKEQQLQALAERYPGQIADPAGWFGPEIAARDPIYHLQIMPLCERLRLMFFGNLHQDWTEFVLADLGIFQFEKVDLAADARGFQSRADIEHYLTLFHIREQWQQGASIEATLEALQTVPLSKQSWLEQRRARLLFALGQEYERQQNYSAAQALYQHNPMAEARIRLLRVLLRTEQYHAAHALAWQISTPDASGRLNEVELQALGRMLGRMQRKMPADLPALEIPGSAPPQPVPEQKLHLMQQPELGVEHCVLQHLHQPEAPVFYVENCLINSLFGLLCWEAIFAALPGAFFHPYQRGPVDLLSPDFASRRQALFDAGLAQLDNGSYKHTIRRHFDSKFGLQSPFVVWQVLTPELLELALHCIPPADLRASFQRLLQDPGNNRSGWPDLIQFFPQQGRYCMIEVKGPGDRLQDNQLRWMQYFLQHQIPVQVAWVSYQAAP